MKGLCTGVQPDAKKKWPFGQRRTGRRGAYTCELKAGILIRRGYLRVKIPVYSTEDDKAAAEFWGLQEGRKEENLNGRSKGKIEAARKGGRKEKLKADMEVERNEGREGRKESHMEHALVFIFKSSRINDTHSQVY